MTESAKLGKKLLKNPSARFSVLTKALLGKKRTCKTFPIKTFT